MTNKNAYYKLCGEEPSIPIFSKPEWLDAVCGDNWDVILLWGKDGNIKASMPFFVKNKFGFKRLLLPKLTQKLGPWIKYPEGQKYEAKLAYEHDILTELIYNLPKNDEFYQKLDTSFTNWLSFYWSGFKQSTHYTYQICLKDTLENIFANFRGNIRREIKKAEKKGVVVNSYDDVAKFFNINSKTFERQKMVIPYSLEFLQNLDSKIEGSRKMYFAEDGEGRVHAAIYIVYDSRTAYYIMGGGDPDLRNSGATSLLMWKAIQEMAEKVEVFDFEGSMIKPIERFFRGFGAKQKPYFSISKISSKRLKLYYFVKDIIGKNVPY